MIRAPQSLRAEVLDQAGQAWLLAGDPARSYAAETAALGLLPDNAELLLDRAEAAGAEGWYDKALADLDRVLKADPAGSRRWFIAPTPIASWDGSTRRWPTSTAPSPWRRIRLPRCWSAAISAASRGTSTAHARIG